jgi:hypothetical protein
MNKKDRDFMADGTTSHTNNYINERYNQNNIVRKSMEKMSTKTAANLIEGP